MNKEFTPNKQKKITRADIARGLMRTMMIRNRDIANQVGVCEAVVCQVLYGKKKSRRVQQAIAFAVGVSYEELWGEAK